MKYGPVTSTEYAGGTLTGQVWKHREGGILYQAVIASIDCPSKTGATVTVTTQPIKPVFGAQKQSQSTCSTDPATWASTAREAIREIRDAIVANKIRA